MVLLLWQPEFIRFRNQVIEMGEAPLLITASDPLAKYLSPVPMSKGLSFKRRDTPTRRHTNDPIELEVRTSTWPLWAPHASESIGQEGSEHIGWGDWYWAPRKNWIILFHSRGKGEYVWDTGDPLGQRLVLSWPVVKVNGQLQPAEMKAGSPHQVRSDDPLRFLLKAKGIRSQRR